MLRPVWSFFELTWAKGYIEMSKIMMDGFERDDFSVIVPPKGIKCFVSSILTDPVNPNIAIFGGTLTELQ